MRGRGQALLPPQHKYESKRWRGTDQAVSSPSLRTAAMVLRTASSTFTPRRERERETERQREREVY